MGKRLPKGWKERFLEQLAKNCNVGASARLVGVSKFTVYAHIKRYPKFAEQVDEAVESAIDKVEAKAFEIAAEGNHRMIMFLLCNRRPDLYHGITIAGKVKHKHVGSNDGAIQIEVDPGPATQALKALTDEQLDALRAMAPKQLPEVVDVTPTTEEDSEK